MAIAEMKKLNLVAMSYDKDEILNALQRTGAVQITVLAEDAETTVMPSSEATAFARYNAVENALSALQTGVLSYAREHGIKDKGYEDNFDVPYDEFMACKDREKEYGDLVESVNALWDERNRWKVELSKANRALEKATPYARLQAPFSTFTSTKNTYCRFGLMPTAKLDALQAVEAMDLTAIATEKATDYESLVCVVCHNSQKDQVDEALSDLAFTDCAFKTNETGEQRYEAVLARIERAKKSLVENEKVFYELRENVRPLQLYSDYLAFVLEKERATNKMRKTDVTFALEAYLPAKAEEIVRAEIMAVSKAIWLNFREPTADEDPPTLLENNAVVKNFESITNTYSTPNYREFDPNTIMSFFYALFMGFIIGDIGYGLLMAVVGGALWMKNRLRPTGMSSLAGAFAVGGVFAIVWGALFNSLFGVPVLPFTVMPDPQNEQWRLAGVGVPSVLVISLLIGIVQLAVGYLCRAVQAWRRGKLWDGILDGVVWVLFSIGVGLAIVGFVDEIGLPILQMVGGITAGVCLVVAVFTAGRKEKFFGKLSKGFGTLYGIINYASDVLSYARLYGLMLSGAVIAKIISTYGGSFIASGSIPMIIMGLVLLIVGHLFNLVMNLLGAYIHDARLQYVEFYGRFYEGEGELFEPIGTKHKYVYLTAPTETATANE